MTVNKGRLIWHSSCDESGGTNTPYYGFGSLWMKWQRRGDFTRKINILKKQYGINHEFKWNKANARKNRDFYFDLIDFFFKEKWMAFHCLIVRKGIVDKACHNDDYDLGMRKHYTMLLTNKIKRCIRRHKDRDIAFRIWIDIINSRYPKADEAMHVIANNTINRELQSINNYVESVITKDSKEAYQIQLCDLLLGAVMDEWHQKATSKSKKEIQYRIAKYLGWENLKADTRPEERKFNIWYYKPKRNSVREVKYREVKLYYPLN